MDEYAHILRESLGLIDTAPDKAIPRIGETMASALSIRTSRVKVDHIRAGAKKGITLDPRQKTMRIRFSMRFGSDLSEDGAEATREDHVRAAFNSPFWPFILASTSIGQEGLDFHAYCHAVVHWNLPSNPVDLEQREGRIHRYKGHAVRKNVARAFAAAAWRGRGGDPWASLFEAARQARPAASEIEPYWVFPLEGGACIERHILNLPLSRDEERLSDLRRSLAVYRMIFGQPRQEDLLAFLLEKVPESDRTRLAEQLRIDLEPPCHPEVNDE